MKNIAMLTLDLLSFRTCTSENEFANDTDILLTMNYHIVGTNQTLSFNDREIISSEYGGLSFYGQNFNYPGNAPSHTANGEGSVTDNVTGLMRSKSPDLNAEGINDYKISLADYKRGRQKRLSSLLEFNNSSTIRFGQGGINACHVCFGRAMGYMGRWIDVHGAGAQRSDPKNGNPNDYPNGFGPQGDAIRIYNFVRLVRNVETD